jgi:hypothetical protein
VTGNTDNRVVLKSLRDRGSVPAIALNPLYTRYALFLGGLNGVSASRRVSRTITGFAAFGEAAIRQAMAA